MIVPMSDSYVACFSLGRILNLSVIWFNLNLWISMKGGIRHETKTALEHPRECFGMWPMKQENLESHWLKTVLH